MGWFLEMASKVDFCEECDKEMGLRRNAMRKWAWNYSNESIHWSGFLFEPPHLKNLWFGWLKLVMWSQEELRNCGLHAEVLRNRSLHVTIRWVTSYTLRAPNATILLFMNCSSVLSSVGIICFANGNSRKRQQKSTRILLPAKSIVRPGLRCSALAARSRYAVPSGIFGSLTSDWLLCSLGCSLHILWRYCWSTLDSRTNCRWCHEFLCAFVFVVR